MSATTDTRQLIAQALSGLYDEVPPLGQLKLVVKLELRSHGSGAPPIWRVEVPGPEIARDPAADARLEVSVARPDFNELAAEGQLAQWVSAYERGQIKVSGEPAVVKLLGNVIQRQLARAR